jgi:hypothetical protein
MEDHLDYPEPNLITNAEYPTSNEEEKVANQSNPSITAAKYLCSKARTFEGMHILLTLERRLAPRFYCYFTTVNSMV